MSVEIITPVPVIDINSGSVTLGGTKNHKELNNLDYENSGHTGFAPAVHTHEDYAKKSEIPSLSGYATEQWVESKNYLTEHQSLADYAKKTELPAKTSDLTNDSGFITEEKEIKIGTTASNSKLWIEDKNQSSSTFGGYTLAELAAIKNDILAYAVEQGLDVSVQPNAVLVGANGGDRMYHNAVEGTKIFYLLCFANPAGVVKLSESYGNTYLSIVGGDTINVYSKLIATTPAYENLYNSPGVCSGGYSTFVGNMFYADADVYKGSTKVYEKSFVKLTDAKLFYLSPLGGYEEIKAGNVGALPAGYHDNSKADKASIVTEGTTITLADNTKYSLSNITTLDISFPSGSFACWMKIATGDTAPTITFPATAKLIGTKPDFKANEEWELSIVDGAVIAGKLGDYNG